MKIVCDVCEKEEASVMCFADEAALCTDCDQRVHVANKLASRHQRLQLILADSSSSSSSHLPVCDICQVKVGYFFCLEDRALLCRQCEVSSHKTNLYVSSHQHFLLTGVKVPLLQQQQQNYPTDACSPPMSNSASSMTETQTPHLLQQKREENREHVQESMVVDFQQQWPLDEMIASVELHDHEYYGFL